MKQRIGDTKVNFTDVELLKINPRGEALTIERLRKYPGFQDISDKEALDVIYSLERLAYVTLEALKELEQHPPEYFEDQSDQLLGRGKYKRKTRKRRSSASQPESDQLSP